MRIILFFILQEYKNDVLHLINLMYLNIHILYYYAKIEYNIFICFK